MNTPKVEPYLFLGGRCDEALAFYAQVFATEPVIVMRFSEAPDAPPPGMIPDDWQDKIMHSAILIGGTLVMMSDGCEAGGPISGFSLSVTLSDEAECRRVFDALADGGDITMPLGATFFSPCFGSLTDRFGVGWMVTMPTGTSH